MTNSDSSPSVATGASLDRGAPRPRHWRRWLGAGVVAALVLGLALVCGPASRYALTGASYGARVACSCRYVGGRSLGDCAKDMEGPVRWVSLSEDPATKSVTASYPLLARQTATYRDGWGCQLQPWPKP